MQFLDIAGVRKLKTYLDNKFQTIESARQKEKVTSAALNDLNTRVVNVEDFKTGFQNENWVRAEEYSQIQSVVRDTYTITQVDTLLAAKQDALVSGTTLKTINNQSLLGSGNISISGGSGGDGGDENVIEAITFNGNSVPVTNKVAAITATLGDSNVIETVKVNDTALTPSSKAVNITVPTKVSDLQNDSGFTTNTGTLTGVKFNNVDASVSNGVASISATIPAAVDESTVSGWGFTKNAGTLTGVKFNNADATVSNGVASITATIPAAPGTLNTNNSTAQTASSSEALSGTINLHKVAKTGTYSDLIGTPTIPTESTVSGWGFTKNAGTLTGVTFNGSAATVSSGVAAITATIPNITVSSSEPTSSQGSNGDIWIVV